MTKIGRRQIYFFLACIAPVGKLVFLPAQLADVAKNDLLFPAAMQYLIQTAAVFCVLLLAKRGMNFFELLANTFGKIAARVLITVYAAFLFFAALLPLLEQKLFVQSVFYDTLPSLVAFAPFFLFTAYLCSEPLASYGRTWDILGPLAIVGFAGILAFSFGSADFAALLPVGAVGFGGVWKSAVSAFSWFFDAALLLPLLGKFDYEKGMAWKGALFYLAGGAAVLLFLAVFYGIFQETAVNQLFAFSTTSKYFSGITMLGRIDYIFIFTLGLVMAFYVTLPLQGGIECLLLAYGRKKYLPTALGVAVSAAFLTTVLLLDYRFGDVLKAITGAAAWIFPVFASALPALMLLLRRERRETA